MNSEIFSPNTNKFLKRVEEMEISKKKFRNHQCLLCQDGNDVCIFRNKMEKPIPIQEFEDEKMGCFGNVKKLFGFFKK